MTKQEFFRLCADSYCTSPDYPFDDWMESAVFRHADSKKWYAIALRVSRRKLGIAWENILCPKGVTADLKRRHAKITLELRDEM